MNQPAYQETGRQGSQPLNGKGSKERAVSLHKGLAGILVEREKYPTCLDHKDERSREIYES